MIKGRAGVATIAVPEVGSMSGFANLGLKPARPDPQHPSHIKNSFPTKPFFASFG
jgi:hypothetical protein